MIECGRVVSSLAWLAVSGLLGLSLTLSVQSTSHAQTLSVFAASSLKDALDASIAQWQRVNAIKARAVYASSAALARHIEHGAPADVYISADRAWMDHLLSAGFIRPQPVTIVAGNRLVLIAPRASVVRLRVEPGFALARALGDGRLAVGNPNYVPAGRYAREALRKLGVWPALEHRLAQAESARSALNFVARAEAPLGIVYRSDARAEPLVRIVDAIAPELHASIEYPAGITRRAGHPAQARSLIDFLRAPQGQRIFVAHGFEPAQ